MTVYELQHTYFTHKGEIYYSFKLLGFFKDIPSVEEAIDYYRTIIGFCDSPNAFVVRRRNVIGRVRNDTIFEAVAYSHTYGYDDYEHIAELGLFSSQKAAACAMENFRQDNRIFYKNSELLSSVSFEVEEHINSYKIGERFWTYGFVVDCD